MHNRKHGRVRAKGVASHLRDGGQLITGLSVENLSRGGAFVRCATPMPLGTAVVLDLVRPGLKKMLQLTGRVVSIVDPESAATRNAVAGMGIQFDAYSAAVGERLTEMLVALGAGPSVLDADPPAQAPALEPAPAFNFSESVSVPDNTRLMVQVKGLLMELGDWQQKAAELERENAQLKAENEKLKAWVEANK